MQLIRGLHGLNSLSRSVVTIGNFDGLHLAHQQILHRLQELSQQYQAPSVLIIFEPTPAEFFMQTKAPARLMRLREKIEALKSYSIDYVLVLNFNAALANLSAEGFVKELLVKKLGMKAVIIGDDFHFGAKRQGDYALLQAMGKNYDFTAEQMPELKIAAGRVSSTHIRAALKEGDLSLAKHYLGRMYSVSGRVAYGNQLGRELGFPTANIHLHRKVVPLAGVFVVQVQGLGDQVLQGVANIGTRPTVDHSSRVLLEVYIFDFAKNIYGQKVSVEFLRKLRDEERYENLEELKQQIALDAEQAREFFANQNKL